MSARRERVSPTGPANGVKVQVSIDHATIPAQSTIPQTFPLPLHSARIGDVVSVNPVGVLPAGIAIAATRIAGPDTLEVTLANITAAPIDPASVLYDVLIRKF